ncbi:pyruvate, phosphate dikinase [Bdellovibrio bacteriovorus]|uniref:Pyruvate, phosphate dikinase n=1 Tax=Bdellovibrio bacteriovorus (strain ATCC 15356 / DSM 50701 / NCIMB 9529 / HD100) TaxID=264462 RepID=Q6MNT6_BDEBA|nr:pyruvate, phosphate dikinase [Bdellovibrio bacteriovorus]AHZ86378.1 pyruvate phosphate dikinase [Bdellovibrio bacteriovorus]BEV67617.1 Pyruvate, phosphate dikinase [Bdellovibrio bacteriovorus]CAE79065.1 pyruvate phosphate dikinase [Bdellovibrio bacteriovorus HD100]
MHQNVNSDKQASKTAVPQKFVYFFAAGDSEGNAGMKNILGGKGANLAEMTSLGIPVPPGFTISTEICAHFYEAGGKLPDWVRPAVQESMNKVESKIGKKFGDVNNPLLVSVRSGARASMPGMMDTILNLGLNDQTVEGLAKSSNNPRFAWDSYRRFIQMYSDVVMGMNSSLLEVTLEDMKEEKHYKLDTEMTVDDLKLLVKKFKDLVHQMTGQSFPADPWEQLWGAISAVFHSWNTPRAITYRELHSIPAAWGTAVNVQSMVFGNMGDDSATGVAFTRNPSTGEKAFYGEFLINAQGEDVVAGIRTPQPITKIAAAAAGVMSLEEALPQAYGQLVEIYKKLEGHYRDMQDIEFTIERGVLWMLQTRNGKRTAAAALKIACDMIDEKLITQDEAILRLDPSSLDQLLHPTLDPKAAKTTLAKGLPASPGGVNGQIVFTSEEAVEWREQGKKVILVRIETSPEDIAGMVAAQGILTTRGGMTSHAAVVARGMGKCCVAGCGDIEVDYRNETMKVKGYVLKKGDVITLDGSTGEVYLGEVKTIEPKLDGNFERIMKIADGIRRLKVRTNADTPKDAQTARNFGAEGIGLCRTEHMFFGADRIDAVREMIIADNKMDREKALAKLLPMQREDFYQLFKIMDGLPVTIRLLDPPLHEFVPHTDEETKELAKRLNTDYERLRSKVKSLHEFNPMLGHRGCRLAITYPEIYQMQVRAIAEAAAQLMAEGKTLAPEIMIPLVATDKELDTLRGQAVAEVNKVQSEKNVKFEYTVGTMIELPRAAITADAIAEHADFFSFGTNDLTQTTLGLSRDDSGRFLGTYVSHGILPKDPFMSIDQVGVGSLVKMGVDLGRRTKPDLKVGVCGEHGGDPESIEFFHKVGLDYVSCSPFRVPIARLAAARAALIGKKIH